MKCPTCQTPMGRVFLDWYYPNEDDHPAELALRPSILSNYPIPDTATDWVMVDSRLVSLDSPLQGMGVGLYLHPSRKDIFGAMIVGLDLPTSAAEALSDAPSHFGISGARRPHPSEEVIHALRRTLHEKYAPPWINMGGGALTAVWCFE